MRFAGEFAALGTAVCWAAGSNLFAAAGQRMGSVVLNRLRITVACGFLGLALLVTRGSPWPVWATPAQVGLLALSGLIGFVVGDAYYFRALVILGPGRAALVASLAPLFTALLGWPVLGEIPGSLALLGMALTVGGIAWVLWERGRSERTHVEGSVLVGVLAGVLGAAGQAGGYVISKLALRSGLDPLSATVIRICAAAVAVWAIATAQGQVGRSARALRDRRGAWFMVGGAFCGPFLGVTLSLTALTFIEAGVAASITAFYPVLAILLAARFHGERLTMRTLVGALVAVAGVVVLFMR
jgi:drug/metabolite transporter (DMT)-like permease